MDQQGLVERARRGDRQAFAELVRASGARLDATARLILRDPDLAQDAVQDTLIRAWRSLPGLRDPATFDHWLHSLVAHACIDLARKRRRRVVEVELSPLDVAEASTRRPRLPIATCSIARWPGSSPSSGRSSSCTSTSTCRSPGSPSCSASRAGRRSRASIDRSGSCDPRCRSMRSRPRALREGRSHEHRSSPPSRAPAAQLCSTSSRTRAAPTTSRPPSSVPRPARSVPAWTFPARWLPVEIVTTRVPTTRLPWRRSGPGAHRHHPRGDGSRCSSARIRRGCPNRSARRRTASSRWA